MDRIRLNPTLLLKNGGLPIAMDRECQDTGQVTPFGTRMNLNSTFDVIRWTPGRIDILATSAGFAAG